MTAATPVTDRLFRVRGTVQGVGFRPFIVRAARELGLRGWVRNDAHGILLRAVGEPAAIDRLVEALTVHPPPAARVLSVEASAIADESDAAPAGDAFVAIDSAGVGAEIDTTPPADLALCAECRGELADPANRRHGFLFINCTQCGPRYSIVESLPYDRPRTTMRGFTMCPACRREYDDAGDRRFHAEPNACPECGPWLALTDAGGGVLAERDAAFTAAVAHLRTGGIAAVKGLGGFHLMCDATNESAVAELRRRKRREEKPFAVMFRDVEHLREFGEVSAAAEALFASPQSPLVLVPRHAGAALAASVAPANPWIGALVATTPLHVRLLSALPFPVVATSANLSEEPLCTDDTEARTRLAGIADVFLGHNRVIARPVDDSVVRLTARGTVLLLRRARGYAPSPLRLPGSLAEPVLCVGAQMKNTIAIASGGRVVVSPHIGDLGSAATRAVFTRTIDTLATLFAQRPAAVVCDKHPDYASTRYAEAAALPVIRVQHHLAHALAVLLEHGRPAEDVIAIAWDGTGYGEDGTIWGGEFIRLRGGRATRFARLRPFRLPGGEAAVHDVRRTAVGLAHALGVDQATQVARVLGFKSGEAATLTTMIAEGLNSPVCSSAGRLFDGVGALLGLRRTNAFEGQTPLAVEIAALAAPNSRATLPFVVRRATEAVEWEIDWRAAIEVLMAERAAGMRFAGETVRDEEHGIPMPPEWVARQAAALHHGLARAIHSVVRFAGVHTAVLCGGCFQNALLHDLTTDLLERDGIEVLSPRELPPNDGAIAAGQALAALWNLTTVEASAGLPT